LVYRLPGSAQSRLDRAANFCVAQLADIYDTSCGMIALDHQGELSIQSTGRLFLIATASGLMGDNTPLTFQSSLLVLP
jgi:isoaspartyl peptidase/L-asparaginase-like protein (Ntn-hydrolase superfamily)